MFEFRNVDRRQLIPALFNPGVSSLRFVVRDLDKVVAAAKAAGVSIVSAGERAGGLRANARGSLWFSQRAIMIRDPDGYPVELMQLTPAPQSLAPEGNNILGAHMSVVVNDLTAGLDFYRGFIGSDLQTREGSGWLTNTAFSQLRGIRTPSIALAPCCSPVRPSPSSSFSSGRGRADAVPGPSFKTSALATWRCSPGTSKRCMRGLCHETFLKAFRSWDQQTELVNGNAWLRRIATNTAYDYLRRRRRIHFTPLDEAIQPPNGAHSMESRLHEQEPVRRVLAQLSPQARRLLLYTSAGHSTGELAAALECSDTAVRLRLFRARRQFRQAYRALSDE